MTELDDNDRAGLAAEYVLGTLDNADKAWAEALIRSDDAFAAEVEKWRGRFDPLVATIPPESAPHGALDDILSRIGREAAAPSAEIIQLRRQATIWKWTAGAAAAVAASLLAIIFIRPIEPAKSTQFVAVLEATDRTPAFIARADLTNGGLVVRRIGPGPAPNRSFELWAIRDEAAPQSLGLVDREAGIPSRTLIEKTAGVPLQKVLLAITDEPEGGSKDGRPSGPPIFTGKLIQAPSL